MSSLFNVYAVVIIALLALNLFSFILYGIDKYKATKNKWRIPEATLLIAAFFGVIGALLGMKIWHHKTRKPKFFITVPLFLVIQLVAVVYFIFIR